MKTIYLLAWLINAVLLAVFCWNPQIAILFIFNVIIPLALLSVRITIFHENSKEDPFI